MYSSKQIRRSWKNARDEIELTPLIESTLTPPVPKIRRIPTILKQPDESNNSSAGESSSINRGIDAAAVKNMDNSIPRFGPLYTVDQPSVQATKVKAWEHVLKKSLSWNDDDEGVIKEIYLTAIRKIEKRAKEAYYNNNKAEAVVGSTFRWMMIRDGCFFLHLVFVILGCSEHLKYAPNDPIFGKRRNNNNRDQFKKWIESMFYVGNQVPLVVLEELMRQKFFQDVITAATAKGGLLGSGPPPGLSKRVLYDVVVLPTLQKQTTTTTTLDLLHGLQNLVMGPKPPSHAPRYDRNINIDLEANEDDEMEEYEEEEEDDGNKRRTFFPCATELEQAGISFTKLESRVGARSIRFRSWYMWATICLPVLPMDGNTETLLRNLKTYEACHRQLGNDDDGREVESYLKFMSDLVQTGKDARLLIRRGIIADISDVERLPGLLRRLSSEQNVRLTHEFSRLRRQIRDYSSPWAYYKNFMSIVVILTLIQTLFALLSYFRPPKP